MQAIWPQILMLCTRQTARGPAHRELVDGRGGEPRRLLPQQAQRFVEVSCRNFSHVQPRLQQLFVGFGSPQVRGRLAEVNGWPCAPLNDSCICLAPLTEYSSTYILWHDRDTELFRSMACSCFTAYQPLNKVDDSGRTIESMNVLFFLTHRRFEYEYDCESLSIERRGR